MMIRAALVLMLAAGLAARQQPQRPPTFRSGAELVRVDVTVTDSRGRPVTNLTAEDFTLEEDGAPQQIQSFKFLEHTGQVAPGDDLSLTISSPQHAATELARDDVRVFLIFWDEYHIPPMIAEPMRRVVAEFVRTMTGPTDILALMDPWTPISDLRFTRDHDELIFATAKLLGRQDVLLPPRNDAEENQMRHARSIPLARAQVSMSAVKSAMMHIGSLRQARSSVIYVGNDFPFGMDSFMTTNELIQAANDANVAFYSISPTGLQVRAGSRSGILMDLASNTGGEALRTNAPLLAFRRIVQQAQASYLLGYSPTPQRFDGKFHKIVVKVRRGGLDVRARAGYWAPDVTAMTRARSAAAESALPPEIDAAFRELVRLDHRDTTAAGWTAHTVLSPDPPSPALSVTMPQLWRVQKPAELAAATSDTPPPPHTGRDFTRTDRLVIRFGIAGELETGATVSVRLVDRRGKRLTDLPFHKDEMKPMAWVIDLPLTSIARGEYVLEIRSVNGPQNAAAFIPLRVSSS